MKRILSLAAVVARYVTAGEAHECWPWRGCLSAKGYGCAGLGRQGNRVKITAHRAAWIVAHGEIPSGLHVLHQCDNPPCCNPAHLYLGTHADNELDKVNRARVCGARNPRARLSDVAVRVIRHFGARGVTVRELASAHRVGHSTIASVLARRTWRQV